MEGIVEENGSGAVDPLAPSPELSLSTSTSSVHSVIHQHQPSVIQTAANVQPMLSKGNLILVGKPNSVIQTTQGNLQALQVVETAATGSDDESLTDDETHRKRRDLLTRRPSYRKILNELGGGEIVETKVELTSSEADSELSSHSIPYHTVIPSGAIQISSGEGDSNIQTLAMTNSTAGGTIVQYSQGGPEYLVVTTSSGLNVSGSSVGGGSHDEVRKREMRLLKNREAARECRRKKKEYIKCLENRVAVLENQNKALIDELKTLKELYCKQKIE